MNLAALVSDRYAIYSKIEKVGAKFLTIFYVLLSLFFVFFGGKHISGEDQRNYDCFMNVFVLGSTIFVIVVISRAYVQITRLAFYFQVAFGRLYLRILAD